MALIELKEIDWKTVTKELRKEAKKGYKDEHEWVLLQKLVASLRDGARTGRTQRSDAGAGLARGRFVV